MKKLWGMIKEHYELMAYVVLTVLLFCACFFSVFAWLAAGFTVLMTILFHKEIKLVGLLLYLHCFYALFNYQSLWSISLDIIIAGIIIFTIFVLYVYRVFKREYKLNLKILIPITLFWIYMLLPFHQCNWREFFAEVFFFVLLYVVFEERKQFNFHRLIRTFVLGLIISCMFALFKNVSPLLRNVLPNLYVGEKFRFQGLAFHANTLAGFLMFAICSLLLLKYKGKISLTEFILAFIPIFIFGYLTISRSFFITVVACMVIFSILYIVQQKTKALRFLSILLVIICAVGGIFFSITKVYVERLSSPLEILDVNSSLSTTSLEEIFDNQDEAWKQDVLAGRVHFDPGRSGLHELYLRDWKSSTKTIWFGRGISRPQIGQMAAHNFYIQQLWKHGLLGYCFYLAMLIGVINWKKVKRKVKLCLPLVIILVPYFLEMTVESCPLDYIRILIVFCAIGFLEQLDLHTVNQKLLVTDEEKTTV